MSYLRWVSGPGLTQHPTGTILESFSYGGGLILVSFPESAPGPGGEFWVGYCIVNSGLLLSLVLLAFIFHGMNSGEALK